jgi:hypothetical protein
MTEARNITLVFCGYKIKTTDLRTCILRLTDLSNALHSFSVRVRRNETPRRKMIIDLEMAEGFEPWRYAPDSYLYELLSRLRKMHRSLWEFVRHVPADSFPEVNFHAFGNVCFSKELYRTRYTFIF